ncbi:MAG: hypothetical protein AAFX05_03870 [Planctomycetota bacterium]
MEKGTAVKVVIAIVCFLIAGAVVAFTTGMFGGGGGDGDAEFNFENTTAPEAATDVEQTDDDPRTMETPSEAFQKPQRRRR